MLDGFANKDLAKPEKRMSALEAAQKGPSPNLLEADDDLDRRRAAREALETPADQPYPVDADHGAALEATINRHVHLWDHFHSCDLIEWLQEDPDTAAGKAPADALENAIRGLIRVGEVAAGEAIELSFPTEGLYQIPLIDGQWIDRHMVELAEFKAHRALPAKSLFQFDDKLDF